MGQPGRHGDTLLSRGKCRIHKVNTEKLNWTSTVFYELTILNACAANPVQYDVFEKLTMKRICSFCNSRRVLPPNLMLCLWNAMHLFRARYDLLNSSAMREPKKCDLVFSSNELHNRSNKNRRDFSNQFPFNVIENKICHSTFSQDNASKRSLLAVSPCFRKS